ncbi:MAG: NAD-dependent epimerase/dehydratase family protein [Myxococcota bacterium]
MDLSGRRIAVTGATGLVGRSLTRALLDRGVRVVAVVRDPARAGGLERQGAELRVADLQDAEALARAFRGAEAVYANAALVSIGQHALRTLVEVNVEGTVRVLEAMARAGVPRVVLTSSATAYAPRPDHFYREDHPLRSPGRFVTRFGAYALSKAMAERRAWELARALGLRLTTVRPHQIHGPFDGVGFMHWTRRLMRAPVTVYPTRLQLPSVYVGDLAEAMCRMLERPIAEGKAYNVAGDPDVTYGDLLAAYTRAGGRRARWVVPVPVPLRRRYDISRARDELGFHNRPLVEGFAELLQAERALVS